MPLIFYKPVSQYHIILNCLLFLQIFIVGSSGIASDKQEKSSVRIAVVSQKYHQQGRSLDTVLRYLSNAAEERADIVLLPMECVITEGESIPGPISQVIAKAAKQHNMYIIGNIRETDTGRTYVTSFLCNRSGRITGKYRKSHKMPDEDMDLGNELPVFDTEFGPVAMRIGSDRYFVDIDHVYTSKGARIIFWSQAPEPVEDEYSQDFPSQGRAIDYDVFIVCARYASAAASDEPNFRGYLTNKYPAYTGMPIGRSYVVNREGMRIASTPRTGGGVAVATIPLEQLAEPGRGVDKSIPMVDVMTPHPQGTAEPVPTRTIMVDIDRSAFRVLTDTIKPLDKPSYTKRTVRITAIPENLSLEELLQKLDIAGRLQSDIVCTYELVWIPLLPGTPQEQIEAAEQAGIEGLRKVAAKARQYGMYVIVAGNLREHETNEAFLYNRNGELTGQYSKIVLTHAGHVPGTNSPVFDTDFGRIAIRICADELLPELDRCYFIKGADILFNPSQSWGPDGIYQNLRDFTRSMDTGMFQVKVTHSMSEYTHRSYIIDPAGVPVAQTGYYDRDGILTAVINLDQHRPRLYSREYTPRNVSRYLSEYQVSQVPKEQNDLYDIIRKQRRPELYQILTSTDR